MEQKISRRTFLGGALSLSMFGNFVSNYSAKNQQPLYNAPRKRLPNPFMENGKPVVIVVHGTDFTPMLKKGMEMLGGFSRYNKNSPVHLKPNFVAPSPYPVTTAGDSILATVELLKKDGFNHITVAEWGTINPGGVQIATEAFKYYELDKKSERGGFKIKDLFDDESVLVMDNRWTAMPGIGICKSVYETHLIINMPTLKQHSQTQFTCALKNTMGQIDKISRNNMHRRGISFESEDRDTRYRMSHLAIAEIAAAVNPELTIVDARLGLGKSHHLNRGGITIKPERIIISGDALAADLVAVEVLEEFYEGFQVEMAQLHLQHAGKLGFSAQTIKDIVIKETSI
jgi:uncharacterized protein (DUF362 family)